MIDQPRARKATWRFDARFRGRIQATVIAIVLLCLFFVLRPIYDQLVETRNLQTCQRNMLSIARGLQMYSLEWDGAYPPGDSWQTAAMARMTPTSGSGFSIAKYFQCPLDKSGSHSSYCYNSFAEGIAPNVQYTDPAKEARRAALRSPSRMPLVFEKHGSPENAHETLHNWDEFIRAAQFPHNVKEPECWLITGSYTPERRSIEQIKNLAGKKF